MFFIMQGWGVYADPAEPMEGETDEQDAKEGAPISENGLVRD